MTSTSRHHAGVTTAIVQACALALGVCTSASTAAAQDTRSDALAMERDAKADEIGRASCRERVYSIV
jgi:hypothetical protein